MNPLIKGIAAVAAGAAAMYYLDPDQGRRRRALVRDKVTSTTHDTADAARAQTRRVGNRLSGWYAAGRARLGSATTPTPEQLQHRVRACLGRVCSHPKAVHVNAVDGGDVRLTGNILSHEVDRVIKEVERVKGVQRVHNDLMIHEQAGQIPELQGHGRHAGNGARHSRLWPVLAVAAPVAIAAVAMTRPRHPPLMDRLSSMARPRGTSLADRMQNVAGPTAHRMLDRVADLAGPRRPPLMSRLSATLQPRSSIVQKIAAATRPRHRPLMERLTGR